VSRRTTIIYASAMIDLEGAGQQPRRRLRLRTYVAAAVAVLLVAGGVTAYLVHRYRGTQVRFEVETASGGAQRLSWDIGTTHIGRESGDPRGKPLSTPWSTTVTANDYRGIATLVAQSSETDEVTCRILVEGKVVAELTHVRAAGCVVGLDRMRTDLGD
jgi:hypothetical protein